jgi:hypothetical protein
MRRFTVTLDGTAALTNFDIVAAAGHDRGTMRAFPITSDGNVDIDFAHVTENPLVNAIEIVRTGPPAAGGPNDVSVRSYDGAAAVGAPAAVANPDVTPWSTARGAFWVGGTLFYNMDMRPGPEAPRAAAWALHRRSFDGSVFGPASVVDPYHDAYWDTVETDSGPAGQTYAGVTVNFYAELPNVTGMFYTAGRLYYTLNGQSGLFWRWFTPDSGVVGADKFTVAGATGFADAGAVFVVGGTLYAVARSTGTLSSVGWVAGAPSGSPAVRSGPGIDGVDWRAQAVFVGP